MKISISPDPYQLHSIEQVIRITGLPRRKIVFYCAKGLVGPVSLHEEDHLYFDQETILRLSHIEDLRQHHRMNWAAISTIFDLIDEVQLLRQRARSRSN